MKKEAMDLLRTINAKKEEILNLVKEKKTKEAKAAKEELIDMQDRFNILFDLDEEEEDQEKESVKNKAKSGTEHLLDGAEGRKKEARPNKDAIVKAYVNRIVCGLRKVKLPEEDEKIMNMMTEADPDENGESDGGFTVPQDIRTDIIALRRTENDLEQYVNIETVSTLSGSRVMEVDAESTPWNEVEEGASFQEEETPKLKLIKYKISKKGGILKVTNELLKDSAINIFQTINKWIAKKSRATRNAAILFKLQEITKGKEINIQTFDDFKDVFNVKLDASIAESSVVITNQNGFNFIDKMKDGDGNYIIQPDITDKTKRLLFGVYPIHVISNKTLKSTKDDNGIEKHPVYMGDLKEAITLFDREKITIELSTEAGDLWTKDLTGIKVRDRFDVQAVDVEAVIMGEIATPTTLKTAKTVKTA